MPQGAETVAVSRWFIWPVGSKRNIPSDRRFWETFFLLAIVFLGYPVAIWPRATWHPTRQSFWKFFTDCRGLHFSLSSFVWDHLGFCRGSFEATHKDEFQPQICEKLPAMHWKPWEVTYCKPEIAKLQKALKSQGNWLQALWLLSNYWPFPAAREDLCSCLASHEREQHFCLGGFSWVLYPDSS